MKSEYEKKMKEIEKEPEFESVMNAVEDFDVLRVLDMLPKIVEYVVYDIACEDDSYLSRDLKGLSKFKKLIKAASKELISVNTTDGRIAS